MILYPAVDIKDGQCVRLKQGRASEVTVFSPDPVAMARHWVDAGAHWLHVVDLDGAFCGRPKNFAQVESICAACAEAKVPVQLGGGIRDIATARAYIEAGVSRLLIGTLALENPALFGELCATLPGQVGVSLDAAGGRLKTKGWVADAGLGVRDVIARLEAQGVAVLVYTDISRDGMHAGVNVPALSALLQATELPVIAAGGISTFEDVQSLWPLAGQGLVGIITGRAIYEGTLDFRTASQWLDAR